MGEPFRILPRNQNPLLARRACNAKSPRKAIYTNKLALLNDFRTFDWAEEYKYPTVVLDQMKGLLAKYENL